MIKSLRIDERLIHGQVAVTWCTYLGVDSIVVANDKTATDEISTMSLKMAAPQSVKVAVRTIEDSIRLLNDSRMATRSVLVLVTNPKDALQLIKNVPSIPDVNVGNYGMIDLSVERRIIATSLSIVDEDIKSFMEIIRLRPQSNYQMTPTLNPVKLDELIKK